MLSWFDTFATAALLAMSSWLGIEQIPSTLAADGWTVVAPWHQGEHGFTAHFRSSSLAQKCRENPTASVAFPRIIHGAHVVYANGKMVHYYGDPTFQTMRSFYGSPTMSCHIFENEQTVDWIVYSYSEYFARIDAAPDLNTSQHLDNIFDEELNLLAFGLLLTSALIGFAMFRNRVPLRAVWSLVGSSILFAGYFAGTIAGRIGLPMDTLTFHKLADAAVFTGIGFFFIFLSTRGLLSVRLVKFTSLVLATTLCLLVVARTGDGVQFGTTLAFPFVIFAMIRSVLAATRRIKSEKSHRTSAVMQTISLTLFLVAICNDILLVVGLIDAMPILSIGIVGAILFSATSLNEHILEAYQERDYLRKNLESEVDTKTRALNQRTSELEEAMGRLKSTQAELVQSAKLASLGTLSAGIAHEINNSLNYVNGSIRPLERILADRLADNEQRKADVLLNCMREGLKLTFGIINSLRSFSGTSRAKYDELEITQLAESVLTIAKNKIPENISVECQIEPALSCVCNIVGMNQVLLNLVLNSVDAMQDGGTLRIVADSVGEYVRISVTDTGSGIPKNVRERIFDPFFTTKEVGKGTGLGLHIVKQEIERHQGTLGVTSEEGKGTTFTITIPRRGSAEAEAA